MASAQPSMPVPISQPEKAVPSVGRPHGNGVAPSPGAAALRVAIISLGGELFTVDLQHVREVFVVESITPVPGMPAGLVGVTNLRGAVVPLLDLRGMFGLADDAVLRYAVVLKHGSWQVAVLVDAVPEIRTIARDQFMPSPSGTGDAANPFISGVVKLEDRLRGVLETSVVLSHFENAA
ncbi:putative Chemotaxis protein CheW [Nitrospira sp. KM1]|uniref:chemotaxis protein CheW n=1 Tax=Nitrospira sp. KM1 TaxID=1936990 RepID=UPI0013A72EC5|nr:chemotaxis protein CheW [Nitrospira sp. KM1]BCA53637.1 putative Chemotaxis protein CheW [Nitrospira sp. KM1]